MLVSRQRLAVSIASLCVPTAVYVLFYLYCVSLEDHFYMRDLGDFRQMHQRLGADLDAPGWVLEVVKSVCKRDYKISDAFPLIPSYLLFGGGRAAYVASAAVLYGIPACTLGLNTQYGLVSRIIAIDYHVALSDGNSLSLHPGETSETSTIAPLKLSDGAPPKSVSFSISAGALKSCPNADVMLIVLPADRQVSWKEAAFSGEVNAVSIPAGDLLALSLANNGNQYSDTVAAQFSM